MVLSRLWDGCYGYMGVAAAIVGVSRGNMEGISMKKNALIVLGFVVVIVVTVIITRRLTDLKMPAGGGSTLAMVLEQNGILPIWRMGNRLVPGTVLKDSDTTPSVEAYPEEAFETPDGLASRPRTQILASVECSDQLRFQGKINLKSLKALGMLAEADFESLGIVTVETKLTGLYRTEVSSEQLRTAVLKPHLLSSLKQNGYLAIAKVVWTADSVEIAFRTQDGYVVDANLDGLQEKIEARSVSKAAHNGRVISDLLT